MQNRVKIVYKKRGQTPLDCINELKKSDLQLAHLPLTYAGRLDPLAQGILIILIGDECLKKDEYLSLSKEYEVEILFGFTTDTYDVMGKVKSSSEILFKKPLDDNKVISSLPQFSNYCTRENEELDYVSWHKDFTLKIQKTIFQFTGRIKQAYPPYSSRTVKGKPLYQWARENKLEEVIIPSHDVLVESIEIIKDNFISADKLFNKIKKDILKVNGDFRQKEILSEWEKILKNKRIKYKTITLRICCGSGVYVRAIAHDLGIALNTQALALNITRTRVGKYKIKDCLI